MINKRLIIDITNLALILVAPFWIYIPVLIISMIVMPLYWEGVLLGVLVDVLYGRSGSFIEVHLFGIIALVIVLAMMPLRDRFRINKP